MKNSEILYTKLEQTVKQLNVDVRIKNLTRIRQKSVMLASLIDRYTKALEQEEIDSRSQNKQRPIWIDESGPTTYHEYNQTNPRLTQTFISNLIQKSKKQQLKKPGIIWP